MDHPIQVGKHNRKLTELRKAIRQGKLTTDGLLPVEGPILLDEARGSAGSLLRLPDGGGGDLPEVVQVLQDKSIQIVGTAPTSESSIEKWDWRKPTAVMIGNEGSGLNREELGYCDTVLRISHNPIVESLNSAIATAVILYEASKQRRRAEPAQARK